MKIKKCSLQKAQQLISENIQQLQGETIDIKDGLHRVTSSVVAALLPRPSFDESVRDGYVIPLPDGPVQGDSSRTYRIVDEIPAGRPSSIVLEPATACRIMTGGCVPEGGVRVIPHENCVERNGEITVVEHLLQSAGTFIRKAGSETEKGDKIVAAGVVLQPMHLARLSASGVGSVMVSRTPSVAYFCTGSELKSSVDGLARGEKVSSNSFLLQGLLASFGCCSRDLGIVDDNTRSLQHLFAEVKKQKFDLIISTGGMGPGKYDLVQETFLKAGGRVIFSAMDMRPGKSMLFGTLDNVLFFGLPGPPHAVQTLLHLLVGPALLAMQGVGVPWPQKGQAYLSHTVTTKRQDVVRFKDGVITLEGGECRVHPAQKAEFSNCFILFPAGQKHYLEGELIDIIFIGGSGIKL